MSENPLEHPLEKLAFALDAFNGVEDLMTCIASNRGGSDMNCLDPDHLAQLLGLVGRELREGLRGVEKQDAVCREAKGYRMVRPNRALDE